MRRAERNRTRTASVCLGNCLCSAARCLGHDSPWRPRGIEGHTFGDDRGTPAPRFYNGPSSRQKMAHDACQLLRQGITGHPVHKENRFSSTTTFATPEKWPSSCKVRPLMPRSPLCIEGHTLCDHGFHFHGTGVPRCSAYAKRDLRRPKCGPMCLVA